MTSEIVRVGQGSEVTISAKTILMMASRIRCLETALREIKQYAEGHHGEEEPCVWLHSLTIDIPHMIERDLDT